MQEFKFLKGKDEKFTRQNLQKNLKFKKAFTILELVFVIIILGILAAIALPQFSSSKDEAEISKSLNNLRTLVNDISIYALRNDALNSIKIMSGVSGIENLDPSNANIVAGFKVGDDENCVKLVFIHKNDFVMLGISSNDSVKNALENIANGGDQELLEKLDFTSTSQNKTCVALSKKENFKALASKIYVLLGAM